MKYFDTRKKWFEIAEHILGGKKSNIFWHFKTCCNDKIVVWLKRFTPIFTALIDDKFRTSQARKTQFDQALNLSNNKAIISEKFVCCPVVLGIFIFTLKKLYDRKKIDRDGIFQLLLLRKW